MPKFKRFMYRRDAGEILYFDTIDKMSKYLQIESRTQRYFTSQSKRYLGIEIPSDCPLSDAE